MAQQPPQEEKPIANGIGNGNENGFGTGNGIYPTTTTCSSTDEDISEEYYYCSKRIQKRSSRPKFLGIEFVPLRLPMRQRLQTLAVLFVVTQFFFAMANWIVFFYILFCTRYYFISLAYIGWMIYDRETPVKGARMQPWIRKLAIWKYYVDYFPITLERSVELDPEKNYIFGYHPHGIMSNGVFGNFVTDATGFSNLFPGITPYSVTISINYWIPFHRDFALVYGIVDCSRESINWLLAEKEKGIAVVIVLGGAAESLDAVPNTMKLTLKSRKGFIKLALQNGASVVPVISFGENEVFVQSPMPQGSWIRKLQTKIKQVLKFTVPIFHGRGIFQYTMGFLPYRQPIHTIVGKPISFGPKNEHPTADEIDEAHAEYVKGLTQLFNQHKSKYATNPKLELELQ